MTNTTHHQDTIYDDPKRLRTLETGFIERKLVKKPWGSEELLVYTDSYALKFLNVDAGERLSLQYHKEKMETLHVLEGKGKVVLGESEDAVRTVPFEQGMTLHVMPGTVHTFEAVTPLRILEASTPQIWDVVRLKDKYDRTAKKA